MKRATFPFPSIFPHALPHMHSAVCFFCVRLFASVRVCALHICIAYFRAVVQFAYTCVCACVCSCICIFVLCRLLFTFLHCANTHEMLLLLLLFLLLLFMMLLLFLLLCFAYRMCAKLCVDCAACHKISFRLFRLLCFIFPSYTLTLQAELVVYQFRSTDQDLWHNCSVEPKLSADPKLCMD